MRRTLFMCLEITTTLSAAAASAAVVGSLDVAVGAAAAVAAARYDVQLDPVRPQRYERLGSRRRRPRPELQFHPPCHHRQKQHRFHHREPGPDADPGPGAERNVHTPGPHPLERALCHRLITLDTVISTTTVPAHSHSSLRRAPGFQPPLRSEPQRVIPAPGVSLQEVRADEQCGALGQAEAPHHHVLSTAPADHIRRREQPHGLEHHRLGVR
mmetsp:Transcript_9019/g.22612  ORF Transcript_9019/g.22612 Transcript_9019/m.22612 type:complete len:213 (-) Transcript_9019:259-897(-)